MIERLLVAEEFDFIGEKDKAFICAFDREMERLGYDCGGKIGSGYCWGRYMLIYTKTGLKTKNVVARVYIRQDGAVLRLFLKNVNAHRRYVEQAPPHVKTPFTDDVGRCGHCREDCAFRKSYTLDGKPIEKCGGYTFEFHDADPAKIPDYIGLFLEFYPAGKTAGSKK